MQQTMSQIVNKVYPKLLLIMEEAEAVSARSKLARHCVDGRYNQEGEADRQTRGDRHPNPCQKFGGSRHRLNHYVK